MMTSAEQVTQLLKEWANGDQRALDELLPLVYEELHRIAKRYMARENHNQTLQTTELINEAYLRLVDLQGKQWQNRGHFFAVAAQAMRCILVDRARARRANKRGGRAQEVLLEDIPDVPDDCFKELIALDDALKELKRIDPRKCRIVELRYFGGLSNDEVAEFLRISTATVKRDWGFARAFLYRELSCDNHADGPYGSALPAPCLGPAEAIESPTSNESLNEWLEPVGGAVPLGSKFYIVRETDHQFRSAIARQDSIVLVKGPRQVGKTSLLARGLDQARAAGATVILSDFQKLSEESFESFAGFLQTLAESFADQLDLDVFPSELWNPRLSPGANFERYLRRIVFARIPTAIVWGLDEIDRLFSCRFGTDVFGLFRSWHNIRALDPQGPWHRFTLAIAYATEAHLFITDLNQSPFNVGTRLSLEDFTIDQVSVLNQGYGSPLRDPTELARYFNLVNGHPYLVRRGLYEMAARGFGLSDLESRADLDDGPFGDHLRRLYLSLSQDAGLSAIMREVLQGLPCASAEGFFRLRSSGILAGETLHQARLRCRLYATYLQKRL